MSEIASGFQLSDVYADASAVDLPFGLGFDSPGFELEVNQMAESRRVSPAPESQTYSASLVFAHSVDAGRNSLVHGVTESDGVSDRVTICTEQVVDSHVVGTLQEEYGFGFDREEFGQRWTKHLSITAIHEGSHLADRVVMGKKAVEAEHVAHEQAYSRKYRIPAAAGVVAMGGLGLYLMDAVGSIAELPVQNAAFLATILIGGLAVVGRIVNNTVHKIVRRTDGCYVSQPAEVRAHTAQRDYAKRLHEGKARPVVVVSARS